MATKNIDEIINYFKSEKEKKICKRFEELKDIKIEPINLVDKLADECGEDRLVTGTLIDDMIRGGLPPSASFLLYGEPATGKSEICLTMAVLCPYKVIFIDTEGSFKAQRLKDLCDARGLDYNIIAKKIIYFSPKNWIEQMFILHNLPSPADVGKIGLIIVDSLTKLFRGIEFAGRGELNNRQPLIREWGIKLKEIAEDYRCGWVLTTQVYQKPDSSSSFMPEWTTFQAVGGLGLEHQTTYTMMLRHGDKGSQIARLVDADDVPLGERPYIITVRGVEELPDSDKAKAIIQKSLDYGENLRKKLEAPSKRGRKKETTTDNSLQSNDNEVDNDESTDETNVIVEEEVSEI